MPDQDFSESVIAELSYQDPDAAVDWLTRAFGFETRIIVRDESGTLVFGEIGYSDKTVALCPESPPLRMSPKSAAGCNTQTVRFRISTDLIAHRNSAARMGATIIQEPELYFFGDKVYVAADPEGHLWSFAAKEPGAAGPPPQGWTVAVS